jgi:hypothetical protein
VTRLSIFPELIPDTAGFSRLIYIDSESEQDGRVVGLTKIHPEVEQRLSPQEKSKINPAANMAARESTYLAATCDARFLFTEPENVMFALYGTRLAIRQNRLEMPFRNRFRAVLE